MALSKVLVNIFSIYLLRKMDKFAIFMTLLVKGSYDYK